MKPTKDVKVELAPASGTPLESTRVPMPSPQNASITGRVTFEDGSPAACASVQATRMDGREDLVAETVSTLTSEGGTYQLELPFPEGLYSVWANLDNSRTTLTGVSAGAQGADITLPRSGELRFRFVDPEGVLFSSDFELEWKQVGESEYQSLYIGHPISMDADGWYLVRLPSGTLDLLVHERNEIKGYRYVLVEGAGIRPGQPLQIEFAMTQGLAVELRIPEGRAKVPDGHDLVLIESELWDGVKYRKEIKSWDGGRLGRVMLHRGVWFGPDGTARIRGLGPGRFRFKVFPDDIVIQPGEIVLTGKNEVPVLVQWARR